MARSRDPEAGEHFEVVLQRTLDQQIKTIDKCSDLEQWRPAYSGPLSASIIEGFSKEVLSQGGTSRINCNQQTVQRARLGSGDELLQLTATGRKKLLHDLDDTQYDVMLIFRLHVVQKTSGGPVEFLRISPKSTDRKAFTDIIKIKPQKEASTCVPSILPSGPDCPSSPNCCTGSITFADQMLLPVVMNKEAETALTENALIWSLNPGQKWKYDPARDLMSKVWHGPGSFEQGFNHTVVLRYNRDLKREFFEVLFQSATNSTEELAGLEVVFVAENSYTGLIATIAKVGLTAIYSSGVWVVFTILRTFTKNIMFRIHLDQMPSCARLKDLCMDISRARHEKELLLEEKLFRELIQIYRSSEALVHMTAKSDEQLRAEEEEELEQISIKTE